MSFWKDLFRSKEQEKTGLVFIVEDNKPYAETLKAFLGAEVPAVEEIKLFPVGETCLLELKKIPISSLSTTFWIPNITMRKQGLKSSNRSVQKSPR